MPSSQNVLEKDRPIVRVVHLDDDPFELERVKNALALHTVDDPFDVTSVSSASEYRQAIQHRAPDIVILDIHLDDSQDPKANGIELANDTRRMCPNTVILMCSTADDLHTIVKCLGSSADDFISKKTDQNEFSLRVFSSYRLARLKSGESQKTPKNAGKPRQRHKTRVVGATMQRIAQRVPLILDSAITSVFIRGESGTGKEVVADLFANCQESSKPFVKVNCGAISPNLLESELFGHVKGAFTGATTDKRGLLEAASGGWIFLDEIATLSPSAQVALLRVLENHEVRRVGSTKATKLNTRILSATNEDIPAKITQGEFRHDLWQRLQETEIHLPALRERPGELVDFIDHFCRTMAGGPYEASGPVREVLQALPWKNGNIRELRNCLRAMTEMHVDKLLTPLAIPSRIWDEFGDKPQSQHGTRHTDQAATDDTTDTSSISISWHEATPPHFDALVDKLLLEVTRMHAAKSGKQSLRGLAQTIGMSRSTLSGRLKALVHKGVVEIDELTKLVGVSEK